MPSRSRRARCWPGSLLVLVLMLTLGSWGATIHVWQDSPSPQPPFDTWETAARVLQEAVDTAQAGDLVLVTNGVYRTGGRRTVGSVTNRLAIPAGVRVQSVLGPTLTFIEGAATPSTNGSPNKTGNGDGAIRCAYLSTNAVLVGFTLRDGHTRTNGQYDLDQSGGGAWCESGAQLVKCFLTNNAAHHMGGGLFRGELLQSQATGNRARYGGGTCLSTVSDCIVDANSAENGGGTYMGRIVRSTLSKNNSNVGGGAMGGSLFECIVRGNTAGQWGGGVSQSSVQRSRIEDNLADRGGGAFLGTLFGCVIRGNTADLGGGAAGGTLRHCTITGNAAGAGGGVYLSSATHCIVYFNEAVLGPNHEGATLTSSCTTPLPEGDSGNVSEDPELATTSHIAPESPCRAQDTVPPELDTDLDGDPWQQPSYMGADQFVKGQATGGLVLALDPTPRTVAVHHPLRWRADAEGRTTGSQWDFGDGTVVRNQPWTRHAWEQPGDYRVTLTVFNEDHPEGVSATVSVRVVAPPIHYVSSTSGRPTPPFTSWETAATSIQAAIDAATVPGSLILVTNGLYSLGATALPGDILRNRVALTKPVVVRSVQGPDATSIVGAGPFGDFAVRAAFVGRDATLSGFTLTNGYTRTLGARLREQRGAGLFAEAGATITNCVLTGNLARQNGGGAHRGTLTHCVLRANHALDGGGGAYESLLDHCVLDRNRANNTGGGVSRSRLSECLLTANTAPSGAASYDSTLTDCQIERNLTEGDGYGGGAHGGTLTDCLLRSNLAYVGGGAYAATLLRCRLEANEARRDGGGAAQSTLTECLLSENNATYGGGASRCLISASELSLNQASVAGGAADGGELERCRLLDNTSYYGGATHHAVLRGCRVLRNTAMFGGGSYRDLHFNGLLTANVATNQGGGAFQSQLFHCTVTENTAEIAGGTFEGTNRNAIVYFNTALVSPDQRASVMVSSCTSPSPDLLPGSVTNPPGFVQPSAGNYQLRAGSPCIDSGDDLSHLVSDDLDGIPRPLDGDADGIRGFDMGAFEYDVTTADSDLDGIPDAWYRQYGLDPAVPGVSGQDPDHDRQTNHHEWLAGTHPLDPLSAFAITSHSASLPISITVPSLEGRVYTLLYRPDLGSSESPPSAWQGVPGQVRLAGTGAPITLLDTNPSLPRYYRVSVELAGESTSASPAPARPPSLARLAFTRSPDRSPPRPLPDLPPPDEPRPQGFGWPPVPQQGLLDHLKLGGTRVQSILSADSHSAAPALPVEPTAKPRASLMASPGPATPFVYRIPFGGGTEISPMLRGQEPFMLYAASARRPTLELGRGTSYRGVAGGTDAETYSWKALSASTRPHSWSYFVDDPPVVTTLEWLEEARAYDAELVLTINTRGQGHTVQPPSGQPIWTVDPASNQPDEVARLAADWVRYANLIAPRYRLTPEGTLPPDLAATDPEADRILQELRRYGNGTNAWTFRLATAANPNVEVDPVLERPLLLRHDAPDPTRKVRYWEIGNEVETPMNFGDPIGGRLKDPAINLTPSQYVERYLRITDAMRRVDPDILVGPCPNNPWGPKPGIENEHLIQLLARPDAVIDLLYYHYYHIWVGDYFRPADVRRNLRALKNYAYQLSAQYAAHFARAGRPPVPAIISEWNPDYTIHPPVERNLLSALATAEVFFSFAELQVLGAHYWENPDGRASAFVFDRLRTHLGDRFLGSRYGDLEDDGSYAGFGPHPSSSTDVRLYTTQRSSDSRVFVWALNLSDSTPHPVEWRHPHPLIAARALTLKNPRGTTDYYTPVQQLEWVPEVLPTPFTNSILAPASLTILEFTYDPGAAPPSPPVISSLGTLSAAPHSDLLLQGKGFSPEPQENIVHFGLGRAQVLAASPGMLRVRVPTTATYGPVSVTRDGLSAFSENYFNLAESPGTNRPLSPTMFKPLALQLYPAEGAPIVSAPVDLQLADWEGIGRLHLAGLITRSGAPLPHTIDLFPNESVPGHPWFSTPICDPQMPRCSLPLNASPARIAFGDFDGDGMLDLASADRHAWHVAVWRNALPSNQRTFEITALLDTGRSPSFVTAHDVDLDARPDLVVANAGDHSFGILPNLSTGPGVVRFGTQRSFRSTNPSALVGPHALVVGNLLGDGRPDVIVASRSAPALAVFEGVGAPGSPDFLERPGIPADWVETLALGDVDGDGRLEIVAAGQWPNGGLTVWRNDGTDHFVASRYATRRDPRQLRLADLNGDGLPELITVNNDAVSVSVFRNRSESGRVAFDDRLDYPIPGVLPNDPICLTAGDVDGDGRTDLVVGNYYSGVITFLHHQGLEPADPGSGITP